MSHTTTTKPRGTRIVRLGAWLLVLASASFGTFFGWQWGGHYHVLLGVLFAGAALGGELLKPFAMLATFEAVRRFDLGRALVCLVTAVVCVGYSLASELALSSATRGDLVAERRGQSEAAKDARSNRALWIDELHRLNAAHPRDRGLDEVAPIVATARVRCHVEATLKGGRQTVCSKPSKLLAEHGRAKRRAELQAKLDKVDDRPATERIVKSADPLASAVAFYMQQAGVAVTADELSVWLYLVPVVFLEIGSTFGLVVADVMAATGAASRPGTVADGNPRRWWRRRRVAELPTNPATVATIAGNDHVSLLRRLVGRRATVAGKTVADPAATVVTSSRQPSRVAARVVTRNGGESVVVQLPRHSARQQSRRRSPDDARLVFDGLERLGGTAGSVQQLARAMGVHKSEGSRRVQAVAHLLSVERDGRQLRISARAH